MPSLFNSALECAIRRVQVNQNGLKFSGTHLVYAGDVNIVGRSIYKEKHRSFSSC